MSTTLERLPGPRRPMWCDSFDMDLLKVFPELADSPLLVPIRDVVVHIHGHEVDGVINHPSVWNDYEGMIAFCGFGHPHKPERFWTDDADLACTFEEILRDIWVHQCQVFFEGRLLWDSWNLQREFQTLMYDRHNWAHLSDPELARRRVLNSIGAFCVQFRQLVEQRES